MRSGHILAWRNMWFEAGGVSILLSTLCFLGLVSSWSPSQISVGIGSKNVPFAIYQRSTSPFLDNTKRALSSPSSNTNNEDEDNEEVKRKRKEELIRAVGEQIRAEGRAAATAASQQLQQQQDSVAGTTESKTEETNSLFDKFNPFRAGQNLRQTIDSALTSIASNDRTVQTRSFYLDDRLLDGTSSTMLGASSMTSVESALERLEQEDFVPEVLVIGATGEVGQLVVRRLLQQGLKVRVLVRDLYSKTLNLLGTGVTYCQGDLNNVDSLEYALTDVDKIVFCAAAPKPDEDQFQEKFQEFMMENSMSKHDLIVGENDKNRDTMNDEVVTGSRIVLTADSDDEWAQLDSVLQVRAQLAEQIDFIGMSNLIRAYQNVRHADYGTAQSAKRTLFKYDRVDDFNLFSIDDSDLGDNKPTILAGAKPQEYDFDGDDDDYGDDGMEKRTDATVRTSSQWIRNSFNHGVFVGRLPKKTSTGAGAEASVVSTRFRSRQDPENGIDLGYNFGGFILRACSDGGTYEVFIRTGAYYGESVEYVAPFSTETKPIGRNKSPNKFTTIRIPFSSFKPVRRGSADGSGKFSSVPFQGLDIRNIGFRYRTSSNAIKTQLDPGDETEFYLALDYVKLFRNQPEPEFVYLSDARIPPVVRSTMVSHKDRQLVLDADADKDRANGITLLDESTLQAAANVKSGSRTPEETYFKYRGEEILKNSGLAYAILRVAGYNESPSGEASTIELRSNNHDESGDLVQAMSRAEAAQVCVSALLDPEALNKSVYISKKKQPSKGRSVSILEEEDIAKKFAAIPADAAAV